MTILIVDDDAKDRALVSKKITEWGDKNEIRINIKEMVLFLPNMMTNKRLWYGHFWFPYRKTLFG